MKWQLANAQLFKVPLGLDPRLGKWEVKHFKLKNLSLI